MCVDHYHYINILYIYSYKVFKVIVEELSMPVLLLWAKDDWITWFSGSKVYQENCPDVKLIAAEKGGHRILPDARRIGLTKSLYQSIKPKVSSFNIQQLQIIVCI